MEKEPFSHFPGLFRQFLHIDMVKIHSGHQAAWKQLEVLTLQHSAEVHHIVHSA